MQFEDFYNSLHHIMMIDSDAELPDRKLLQDEMEWVREYCIYYTKHPDERHPAYEEVVNRAINLSLHFDCESGISDKIAERRPTEEQAFRDYRESAWEPVNYSWMQKILTFFQKIFSKHLSNVSYGNVESPLLRQGEDIQTYLTKGLPKFGDFLSFAKNYLLRHQESEPDGWIAVISKRPDFELERNELRKPFPVCIPACDVVDYDDDFVLVASGEQSELSDGTQMGRVYWMFTRQATYKCVQIGKPSHPDFEIVPYDDHRRGEMAITQTGGIPRKIEDGLNPDCKLTYDSHIQPAIPHLNKMIQMTSDIDAVYALHMFLQKVEMEIPCDACKGKGNRKAKSTLEKNSNDWIECDKCEGSGYDTTSLFSTFKVKPEFIQKLGSLPDVSKYIEIPTEIIDKAENRIRQLIKDAFMSLNLGFLVEEGSAQKQTAESKRIDQELTNNTLMTISKDTFRLVQFVADWINVLRYEPVLGSSINENRAVFATPEKFNIESESEIIAQLQALTQTKNAPNAYLQEMYIDAGKKRFGDQSEQYLMIKAAILLDPLFGMDEGVIFSAQSNGKISELDCYIKFNLLPLIHEVIESEPDFLTLPLDVQKEFLAALALSKNPEQNKEEFPTNE